MQLLSPRPSPSGWFNEMIWKTNGAVTVGATMLRLATPIVATLGVTALCIMPHWAATLSLMTLILTPTNEYNDSQTNYATFELVRIWRQQVQSLLPRPSPSGWFNEMIWKTNGAVTFGSMMLRLATSRVATLGV